MATQNFRVKNGLEVGIGATILVAENNGNIGINSTTPTQKLDVAGTARIEGLIFGSGTEVTSVDADLNAVSSSHDTLASAKAIKSYVDQQITAEDLDFSGDSGTGSVDLDSQSLSISGTTNEIETSASGQTLTIGLPDEVSIASTLTVASSTTINSSGIDISTNLTVDGLSDLDELNVAGLSTFASNVDINAGLDVDGLTDLDELNVSGVSTFQGHVKLGDSDELRFGGGHDLLIYSNGTNGIIRTGSGSNLNLRSAKYNFRNQAGTEQLATFTEGGSVELYYDNSKKFETTGAGVSITGIATATTFSGSGASLTNIPNGALDNSSVNFGGVTLSLGQSDTTPAFDLQDATNYPYTSLTGISTEIVHDTTPQLGGDLDLNSNDITGTGNIDITGISTATTLHAEGGTYNAGIDTKTDVALIIDEETSIYTRDGGNRLRNLIEKKSDVIFIGQQGTSLTDGIELQPGVAGSVKLHFGSTQSNVKLQTTSTGIDVTGHTETDTLNVSGISTFQSNVHLGDDDKLRFGDGNDLEIYHNAGNASYIRDVGTGNLNIDSTGGNIQIRVNTNEPAIVAKQDGAVDLYYDNSKKFETVGTGVSISSGTASTATIYGPGNLIIDPAPVDDNGGIVRIKGDLYVDGTTTEINSTTLTIDDLNIVVASGATNSTAADGAGITVDGASATLQYATSGDKWVFNKAPYYNANRLLTTADEGSGNGIDADTLDGQEGTYYLDYANFSGIATDSDKLDGQQGTYYLDYANFSGIATDSDKLDGQHGTYYLDYSNFSGIATDSDKLDGQQGTYYLDYANFSGIATDSDKLDGQQGTYYLNTSGTSQTKTGDLIINGNLGLGTSPSQKLDVNGAVRLRGAVYDNNNSVGTSSKVLKSTGSGVEWGSLADLGGISGVTIADDNSSTSVFNIAFTDSSGTSITELDVSSSNLTYKPEGKLGIGTNNPSVTLDVDGTLSVSGITTIANNLELTRGSAGGSLTRKLIIGGARNNGSDFAALQFKNYDSNSGAVDYVAAEIKGSVPTAANDGGELVFLTTADGSTSRTERVRITSAGNFGIGTNNPQANFVVSNSGNNGLEFDPENSTGTNRILSYDRNSGQRTKLEFDASEIFVTNNTTEYLRLNSTGLGIGTDAPTAKLDVRGTVNVTGISTFTSTVNITPSSDVQGLVIDGSNVSSDNRAHLTLKGGGPQVIDFRDNGDGSGIRISYRTTPNEWRLEKSEDSNYYYIVADRDDGRVDLYHGGSKKFETTDAGVTITGIATATTFSGSGASLTSIPNSALDNSSVNFGGVAVSLGSSDLTPAFDLSDATNYPTSSLTGTITNDQLAGSIANGKLVNSSVNFGGVAVSLGSSDLTPAFDLSDATNYPYTSLTGISTNIVGDTTPQLGGDLDLNSKLINGTGGINVTGIVTATSFVGPITGTASSATQLENARNFSITGDFITASNVSFDGTSDVGLSATITTNSITLGTYTSGDYVESISGTANQITVTSGTGEGSTPVISIPDNPTLPGTTVTVATDLQVNRNLNVTGNITIGGTTAFIDADRLRVSDSDIVLGYRTDANNNDASTDSTASHGGVALASTEGTPLVSLVGSGETLPSTYKKIMWFESGSFSGLGTDAWLINYGVGIGSTQVPYGVVLAAGDVHVTNSDIKKVRDINSSGIITATSFVGSGASLTDIPNDAFANSSVNFGGVTVALGATDLTPAFDLTDATNYPYTSLTGISTEIVYDTTPQLGGDLDLNSNNITGTGNMNVTGIVTATTFSGAGVTITGIATATTFSGSGASLTNIPNSALDNSGVNFGGVTVSLGATDATPAFDLSDATNYPFTSLTGIATHIVGDTTPQLGGTLETNGNLIKFGDSASATDDRLMFGANNDLQIYHGAVGVGSTSYIDNNAGDLLIRNNVAGDVGGDIYIEAKPSEKSILCTHDAGVHLYYNGLYKFQTTSTGITVNGTAIADGFSVGDNEYFYAGDGNDLQIYHNGTSSYIENITGHLILRNSGSNDDSNVYIQAKDGENSILCEDDGTVALYYDNAIKFQTTDAGARVTGIATADGFSLGDNEYYSVGTGDDLQIYHTGNHTYLDNDTGNIYIRNNVASDVNGNIVIQAKSGENSIICYDDQGVLLYYDGSKKFETTTTGFTVTGTGLGNFKANDNEYLTVGTGDDLQIYHSGNHTYLDNDTGNIYIRNNVASDVNGNIVIQAKSGENSIVCYDDQGVLLYYDGSKKFETTTTGITVTGVGIGTWKAEDNKHLIAGTGDDFKIYHSGNHTYLDNDTGNIYIRNNVAGDVNGNIYIQPKSGENSIVCFDDAEVRLYYDNSQKFETTNAGVIVTGIATADGFSLGDSEYFTVGTDNDLQIHHNTSNSIIEHDGTGNLYVQTTGTGEDLYLQATDDVLIRPQGGENGIKVIGNAAVELYYDNDKKFETTGYGVTISGGMNVSGVTTSTDFNTTSDQNLKTNIQTIEDPLKKIVQIRGVNFEWKENNKPSAGVIAQEIEKVLPQLVNGSDTKTVNYNGLIGLLIETVKEQQKQIDNLNTRLSKLE